MTHAPTTHVSRFIFPGARLLAAATLATTASCALASDPDVAHQSQASSIANEAEEAQLESAELTEALDRKARYLATGQRPPVPAALSSNPNDPQFEFLGYANQATEADVRAMEARMERELTLPMSAGERASLDQTIYDQSSVGVLVNSVGETWRWRPASLSLLLPDPGATESAPANPSGIDDELPLFPQRLVQTSDQGVLGNDQRQMRSAVSGHDMTAYPWHAIGALNPDGQPSDSPSPKCTATKIGARHLLTAGHCVWTGGSGGAQRLRDWWHGQDGLDQTINGGDPSPNGYKNIWWYWVAPGWYDHGWSSQDYAVLMLYDNQNSVDIGSLGYKVDNTLAGTDAWNFGYPGSSWECANSPLGSGLCGKSMWGMEAQITRTEIPYLFFEHDIQKGHSGSPIYQIDSSKRYIVGVVTTLYTSLENRGVKIRKAVFDNVQAVKSAWPSSFD
jgi:V8-like Glu-specific endopeptidase